MIEIKSDDRNDSVYLKIQNISSDVKKGIRKAYFNIGKEFIKYTSKKMKEKKSGRSYTSYRTSEKEVDGNKIEKTRRYKYQASAPGEFPLSKAPYTTGKLRKSLNFKVQGWQQLKYSADTPYASYLEKGTKKMKKRPYLKPTIVDNLQNSYTHFKKQIDNQLKK